MKLLVTLGVLLAVGVMSLAAASNATCNCTATSSSSAKKDSADLTWEGILVLITIAVMIAGMAMNLIGSLAALFLASVFFAVVGIISTKQLFIGFVNKGMLSIGLLFVIVHPLATLPIAQKTVLWLLSSKKGQSKLFPLFKLCMFSWITSPFLENVPQVAVITPIVTKVCHQVGIHPQQMLLSMAFSICTSNWLIIASASNLIVQALQEEEGSEVMGFFELAKTNLPVSLILQLYFVLAPQFLFSETASVADSSSAPDDSSVAVGAALATETRDDEKKQEKPRTDAFNTVMQIPRGNSCVGRTVGQAMGTLPSDLRDHVEIPWLHRDRQELRDPAEDEVLDAYDEIVVAGPIDDLRTFRAMLELRWVGVAMGADGGACSADLHETAASEANSPVTEFRRRLPSSAGSGGTREPVDAEFTELQTVVATSDDTANRTSEQGSIVMPADRNSATDATSAVAGAEEDAVGYYPAQHVGMVAVESKKLGHHYQLVLSMSNPVLDTMVGSRAFSNRYQVTVLAVRDVFGNNKVGEDMVFHKLCAGDTVHARSVAGAEFVESWNGSTDFYVMEGKGISLESTLATNYLKVPSWFPFGSIVKPSGNKYIKLPAWFPNMALLIFLAVVIAAMVGINLALAAAVGIVAQNFLGLVSTQQAIGYVDWNVYCTGSFAFGIGFAMTESGLAFWIAQLLVDSGVDGFWLILLLAFLTSLVGSIVSNRGAIQVMYPIAASIFRSKGLSLVPCAVVIATAAMGGFFTPYGLTPALIVAGPGEYKPYHYLKFGIPLLLLYTLLSALMTAAVYNMW